MAKKSSFQETKELILSDKKRNKASWLKMIIRPKLALMLWFRICSYFKCNDIKALYLPSLLILHVYRQLTGIQIDAGTQIGGGCLSSIIHA